MTMSHMNDQMGFCSKLHDNIRGLCNTGFLFLDSQDLDLGSAALSFEKLVIKSCLSMLLICFP